MNNLESIIKAKINLADYISRDTPLKRLGGTFRGACPIHGGGNDSSLAVFPTNTYYCFSCGTGGNVINYVADKNHISYEEATERLAEELNIDYTRSKDYMEQKDIILSYRKSIKQAHALLFENDSLSKYLKETRKLTRDTLELFSIGADQKDGGALVIPIYNHNDQPVGVARRYFNGSVKYRNSKNNAVYDKSQILYGLNVARRNLKDTLYLAEGYFDVMAANQLGLPTAGYCGAEVGREQIAALSKVLPPHIRIVIIPDQDEAGLRHLDRVRERFQALTRFEVRVLPLPEKDMGDMLSKGVKLPTDTVHIDKFVLLYKLNKCKTKEEEYEVANEFMNTVRNKMLKADLIDTLAERWHQDKQDLRDNFRVSNESAVSLLDNVSTLYDCVPALDEQYERGTYPCGIHGIDECIGGVSRGQVVVFGAYSSSGKTSFVIDYIISTIRKNNLNVVFFSQEMTKGQVLEWILAKMIPCRFYEVRQYLHDTERIREILSLISEHLLIIDKNGLTMDEVEDTITAINSKGLFKNGKVDLVAVDYLQYMKGTEEYSVVAQYSKSMKRIAKEKGVIFVMLSQLNRQSNQYEEPSINLLKGSGDIEASADYIILFWRPAQRPGISLENETKWFNITRFNIAKIRGYQMGSPKFMMKFNSNTSQLEECKEIGE